jgi:formylglycine-generating enzyme required for sulfatase activity
MVKIKAKGYDFEMGQPCDTVRGLETGLPTTDLEQPVHTVNFSYDFWMDTVEVLQSEYDSLMKQFYGSKYIRPSWSASNGLGNNYAAYIIEWGNAVAFCNARSKAEGLPDTAYSYSELSTDPFGLITLKNVSVKLHANAYRLPTEAEWEYACKGGTFTDYYWGKDYRPYPKTSADSAEAGQYAIFTYNSSNLPKEQKVGDSYYGVNEVARKKPNKYGLYDILGNVSEWCSDWFGFYPWGTVTDPTGIIPTDMNTAYHPLRGGNWGGSIAYLRATERGFPYNDYYYLFEGFRCVSSGISTGIKKVNRSVTQNLPSIDVSSGLISFNNVTNSKIEIYSLSGKTICSVTSLGNKYSFPANKLCAGSYIVNIKSNIVFNKTITITQ